jgi:hypothetical protein
MNKNQYILILSLFVVVLFSGCETETEKKSLFDNRWNNQLDKTRYIDCYEIADDKIVYTSINYDVYNYVLFINGYFDTYSNAITENHQFIDDYNLTNIALDKNETFNAYKITHFNTFTNKSFVTLKKENFGTYEVNTNYCIINAELKNCKTYFYMRYE